MLLYALIPVQNQLRQIFSRMFVCSVSPRHIVNLAWTAKIPAYASYRDCFFGIFLFSNGIFGPRAVATKKQREGRDMGQVLMACYEKPF